MTLRQKLACVGLTVFGLQIASAAAGGAPLADRLRLWLDPEQLLLASVRMELGAPPVDASPTPEVKAGLLAQRLDDGADQQAGKQALRHGTQRFNEIALRGDDDILAF